MVTRIFDILDNYRYKYPLLVALASKRRGKWKYYSGLDYVNQSNAFSYWLLANGFKKGDIVVSISNSRPEWNITDMGILQIGAIHTPLNTTLSTEDYRYILNLVQPKAIIVSSRLIHQLIKPIIADIPSIKYLLSYIEIEDVMPWLDTISKGRSEEYKYKEKLERIKKNISSDDLSTIIFTSGTTGKPKGVMLSHNNIVSNLIGTANVHDFGYGCKAISFLPLSHAYERMMNLHLQYKGVALYYAESINTLLDNIREVKPEIMTCVPRVFEKIYDGIISKGKTLTGFSRKIFQWSIDYALNYDYENHNVFYQSERWLADQLVYTQWIKALGGNLQIVVSGGAPLQPRLANFFTAAGLIMVEGYGLTETSPVIAVGVPKKKQLRPSTVGPILEGVTVRFGEDGEILCKGPNIMMGYYKDPEQTAQVIDEDGWFHTGDIGCLEDDLYLKITDRKKEIFKLSSGKYVAPAPIELLLSELPMVVNSMVIGEDEKYPSAIISANIPWLKQWAKENDVHYDSVEELINSDSVRMMMRESLKGINQQLASYEKIKRVRLVADEWTQNNGFLSASLKVKRAVLKNHYRNLISEIYKGSD